MIGAAPTDRPLAGRDGELARVLDAVRDGPAADHTMSDPTLTDAHG